MTTGAYDPFLWLLCAIGCAVASGAMVGDDEYGFAVTLGLLSVIAAIHSARDTR